MYLNCHSYFSLNYGTMSVEALLAYAKDNGVTRLSLTDINNTSGILDFLRLAPKHGIIPSVGIDFRNDTKQLFIGIAKNNDGFKELNDYLTIYRQNKKEIPSVAPPFQNVIVIYSWIKGFNQELRENEYVGLKQSDITRYRLYGKISKDRLVIQSPVSFRHKHDYNTHRLLRAIYYNIKGSQLTKDMQGKLSDCIVGRETLSTAFEEFDGIVENTYRILESCHVNFEFGKPKNKLFFNTTHEEDVKQLKELATEGLLIHFLMILSGGPTMI